jgi:RNase adaptor protein for sRNA GlmZ degradation
MRVSIVSFSYPRGVPEDADDYWGGFVFDCRSLPDPHDEAPLRGYSGQDKPVIDFFARHKDRVDCFLDAAESLVRQTIEAAPETGRDYLQIAFGCYGGRHRSEYLAERFAERLASSIRRVNIGTNENDMIQGNYTR